MFTYSWQKFYLKNIIDNKIVVFLKLDIDWTNINIEFSSIDTKSLQFIEFFNDKQSYCIHSFKCGNNTSVIHLKDDIKNESVDLTHDQKFDIGHIGHKEAQYNCGH